MGNTRIGLAPFAAGMVSLLGLGLGMAGCGSGEATPSTLSATAGGTSDAVNGCDGLRHNLKHEAIRAFGFDVMMGQMQKVSAQISPEEREVLVRLSPAMDSVSVAPELRDHAARVLSGIYSTAIDRAGLRRGAPEAHAEIHRSLTAELREGAENPLGDGFTAVLHASAMPVAATAGTGAAAGVSMSGEGVIEEAVLGVRADQNRYELILLRAGSVKAGRNHGHAQESEYIRMSEYIETQLPESCRNVGTALPKSKLDEVSAVAPGVAQPAAPSA